MGIFDMRCVLSGLSTSWPGTSGPATDVAINTRQVKDLGDLRFASDVRCSMFLAEKRDGKLVPTTQPVSGFYNYYGGLVADRSSKDEKLFESPDDDSGDKVACLYRDDVAEAIAGPDDAGRFERLQRWAEKHGGLSVWDSGEQFTNKAIKEHTKRAWRIGDLSIQRLIRSVRPQWVTKWATAEDGANELRARLAAAPAKPYRASERFAVGDLIEHPTFGRGLVEILVVPNKINVKFIESTKVLVHKPS
jgi:hypothetical protein